MIGDTFKNLKRKYTDITLSDNAIDQKWQLLSDVLPEQDIPRGSYHFTPYSFAFAGILVLVFIVTISFARFAKPGSILYPVTKLTQELSKGVSYTFQPYKPTITPIKLHTAINDLKHIPTTMQNPTNYPTPRPAETEDHKASIHLKNSVVNTTVLGTQSGKYQINKYFSKTSFTKAKNVLHKTNVINPNNKRE